MEKIAEREREKTMPVGIYTRTKAHKEAFKERMHTPEIGNKRWESRRKNEKQRKKEEEKAKEEQEREILMKEKTNKFDGFDNRIENLDRDELADKLIGIKGRILAKVKELTRNMETLKNLQKERDRIEIRQAELGIR